MRRREFLVASAAFAALDPRRLLAQRGLSLQPVGLQLYTLRELAKQNLERTLAAVAEAGYKEVELAGYYGHRPSNIRRMLDNEGLKSPSGHHGASDLESGRDRILDDAGVLGHDYVTVSWIDEKDRTPDGYRRIASLVNTTAPAARSRGLGVAYHNNTYEFTRLSEGRSGYEILTAECPPENLALQADVFWMKKAGQDPLAWFTRHTGRYRMMHLKDMGPAPAEAMVDVGSGVMDWPRLISAAKKAGVKHFFVEHDEPQDPMASIRRSYRYLSTNS